MNNLDRYAALIRETGLYEGARAVIGNGRTATVIRLGPWVQGVCVRADGAPYPEWVGYDRIVLAERCTF